MFLVPIWMEYFHAENKQCSQILDYKLISIRKQPDNLKREKSTGQLGTKWEVCWCTDILETIPSPPGINHFSRKSCNPEECPRKYTWWREKKNCQWQYPNDPKFSDSQVTTYAHSVGSNLIIIIMSVFKEDHTYAYKLIFHEALIIYNIYNTCTCLLQQGWSGFVIAFCIGLTDTCSSHCTYSSV